MALKLLTIAHLVTLLNLAAGMAVKEEIMEVKSVIGEDCTFPCPAIPKPGVQYLAITWYKELDPSSLSGLLTRDLPNGTTRWYRGVDREVELLSDSSDIFMPNLTCADRGVYTCHLAAPVGEQNRERQVLLIVSDCPDESTETLVTDAYMVVVATLLLMFALIIFRISYVCLRNTLREKNTAIIKETLLDGKLKPLEKKDLMLIQTLGPKPSMKHVIV
ncbi:CD83 antigen [Cheilinus undulatus]|uniref:CD83 antigen n=1 Tax=Cheilinus undulatus TaxID=241271 RepID=UPI001BD5F8DA|nr:CD83 antigen [Cheilinus undulatus]